jgi:uncharacterized protein (DUF58 family)
MPEQLLRALDLTIGRRINGLLTGDYRSAWVGSGTELAQIRAYEAGDDVRKIDWNVTARTGTTHIRANVAERMLTTWLVLDTSPSMHFGTATRRKSDVAEGVALAVGHIATRRGNRLGVVTFGDAASRTIPPGQGRTGMRGLHETLRAEPQMEGPGNGTLAESLGRVAALARMAKVVIVVSDFRDPGSWQGRLAEIAHRHAVLAVEVRDPREMDLPNVGELWLVDPETGRQLRANTGSSKLRERFREAAAAERGQVAQAITRAGAQHLVLNTEGDWLREFAGYLSRKGARL